MIAVALGQTYTESFTRTHARYLASKVVADLYQCARLYGSPSTRSILDYESELVEMLAGGYVSEYEFGLKQNEKRLLSWSYRVTAGGDLVGGDDRPGGLFARASVAAAFYYNFLSYSPAWFILPETEKQTIFACLPFTRTSGSLPTDGNGYWIADRTYSNGGVAVARRTFRPL